MTLVASYTSTAIGWYGYSGGRQLQFTSNGNWVIPVSRAHTGTASNVESVMIYVSTDAGSTWTKKTSVFADNDTSGSTRQVDAFIDADDEFWIIRATATSGQIDVFHGVPNANKDDWTWTKTDTLSNLGNSVKRLIVLNVQANDKRMFLGCGSSSVTLQEYHWNGTSFGSFVASTTAMDLAGSTDYAFVDFDHIGDGKTPAKDFPTVYAGGTTFGGWTGVGLYRFNSNGASYSKGAGVDYNYYGQVPGDRVVRRSNGYFYLAPVRNSGNPRNQCYLTQLTDDSTAPAAATFSLQPSHSVWGEASNAQTSLVASRDREYFFSVVINANRTSGGGQCVGVVTFDFNGNVWGTPYILHEGASIAQYYGSGCSYTNPVTQQAAVSFIDVTNGDIHFYELATYPTYWGLHDGVDFVDREVFTLGNGDRWTSDVEVL